MLKASKGVWLCALVTGLASMTLPAAAVRLEVADSAPAWAHLGAAALLIAHIAGGAVGIGAGIVAALTRKGSRRHRLAGRVFVGAMFVAYLIGGAVAPFLTEGQRPNFVAAVLALYLLLSGVRTARRKPYVAGRTEVGGLIVALGIVAMGVSFALLGARSATGTVDGSPPQAFVLFIFAGTIAALGEINVLARRKLSEISRQTRHLWRMCFSFFIATGSLFLGQPQVFPDGFNDTPAPLVLAFLPLFVLLFAVARLRWRARRSIS